MLAAALALATIATGALATPFSVPADDARWTVTPRYMRALEVFHGVGCLAGSDGLVMRAGVRAELLFNGTQLRLVGIAPPLDTQILMDGEPLPPRSSPFTPGAAACVPFAEWAQLHERTPHNLTIVAPPTGHSTFLIANATGTALDLESSGSAAASTPPSSSRSGTALDLESSGSAAASTPPSSSPSAHPLPDSSPSSPAAQSQPQSDASSTSPSPTPHAGLLIAAVLAPLALFLAAGFGLYFYRARRASDAHSKTDGAATVTRSRSFKGMHETQFVMVPATVRPETGTPGVVKV